MSEKKNRFTRRRFLQTGAVAGAGMMLPWNSVILRNAFGQVGQGIPLPGNKIAQFVDPLPDLHLNATTALELEMREFPSMVMPTGFVPAVGTYNGTYVWGYLDRLGDSAINMPPQIVSDMPVLADIPSYIGPVVLATRGGPTEIKFVNKLGATPTNVQAWDTSTDRTLHWADPLADGMQTTNYSGPIPAVPHLHGGEVPPELDGGPDAWFTSDGQHIGHAYHSKDGIALQNYAIYRYPNSQEGANIWFHDHVLGITRLNVYAGMAGAYIIDEPGLWAPAAPKPALIPLVIQDRMFDVNGQLFFPNLGINPEHPFWIPEFVGDTIVVNGKVWPYKAVNRQRYTLLFLNGSNARFYDMFLIDPVSGVKGPPMYVISTDGGYLANPVMINPNATGAQTRAGVSKSLVVGPGERYEAIVDFNDATWRANLTAFYGTLPATVNLHLRNTAKTPFPGGAPAPNNTTGRIMQFTVNLAPPAITDGSFNPAGLAALRSRPIIRLFDKATFTPATGLPAQTWTVRRQLTLNEVMGPGGPLEVLVNNTKWDGESVATDVFASGVRPDFLGIGPDGNTYYSELPKEGDTELWEIINLTADAHPIHLHLVQFQLVSRQAFDVAGYNAAYNMLFPGSSVIDPMTGAPFPAGVFIGGFGPPADYSTGVPFNGTPAPVTGFLGGNPDVTPFLNAKRWPAMPPLANEEGWKDTVIMYPGQVTRIMVRWAPTDVAAGARGSFPFSPDGGHGYVWHCHIIDHEDNEMMRPDKVVPIGETVDTVVNPGPAPTRSYIKGTDY